MPVITIKDQFGDIRTYEGKNLKIWRDGSTVEIYYNKSLDGGNDSRKMIVAVADKPALVEVLENLQNKEKRVDPFTPANLEKREDNPEEKALLDAYKSIEKPKKKRGRKSKAELEALKLEKDKE